MRRGRISLLGAICVLLCACETSPVQAIDPNVDSTDLVSGEGYNFPVANTTEVIKPRLLPARQDDVLQRQIVVDQINLSQDGSIGTFNVIVQAVGENQKTLLLTVFGGEQALTPFAARAFMGRATSVVRTSPVVIQMGLGGQVDAFDIASAVGFERVVVSDGYSSAHTFAFKY